MAPLVMSPTPGERLLRFVGDRVRFELKHGEGRGRQPGWRARLRTNLGRAGLLREEIIRARAKGVPLAGASWRDLPMREDHQGWSLELPLAEPGWFKAKPYLLDPKGWQHWPEGPDTGVSVHPDSCRTANVLYCAFARLFGPPKTAITTRNERLEHQIQQIEGHGFTIIPPSGKLRDLIQCLPHIFDVLGCRVLHLLPVNPTPTTYARFGRFGSPYAALDLTAIDPALVVFDKRTSGVDQFRELTYATHCRGGRVFLDIVINHTGWGSTLQENHPQWFLRDDHATFVSPGAWGVTWEDLVELKHDNVALWDQLAEMFLTWCRRGVDGFRCDAGYKVPVPAWQYIVARVQQEYPETIFLLEGLGGAWETTEALLTEGGLQWAYSELFQNYSGREVAGYLDYSLRQSGRVGVYVHYSETHDNERLAVQRSADVAPEEKAKRGRAWSLLRNRLCALASASGGFGFTCGVEWLATEKINVHGSTGLAWNNPDNLVPELAQLNRLLAEHPCFFDGAKLTRLSPADSPVYALLRESAEGKDSVLVLVNTELERAQTLKLETAASGPERRSPTLPVDAVSQAAGPPPSPGFGAPVESGGPGEWKFELLGQSLPEMKSSGAGEVLITLPPGAAFCLSPFAQPRGLSGDTYRRARAQAAWALQALSEVFSVDEIGHYDWRRLAELVERSPFDFLAAIHRLDRPRAAADLVGALEVALGKSEYPRVVRWSLADRRRIAPVPPGHWLLIEDNARFRASLRATGDALPLNVESIPFRDGQAACVPPRETAADAALLIERCAGSEARVEAALQFLDAAPGNPKTRHPKPDDLVLLTNGIGGMARLRVDLSRVRSKYDCVLGANLHPSLPVDRHVLVKRIRVWVNADGFISPLDARNLFVCLPGPPAEWQFRVDAGDARSVIIHLKAEMIDGHNAVMFRFVADRLWQPPGAVLAGRKPFFSDLDLRLTVRFDIEDRNFHTETHRDGGAEHHFSTHTRTLPEGQGFSFTPAEDRRLFVFSDHGVYHPAAEWSQDIPHPVEQTRGQVGSGDAFSPGWFDLPMPEDTVAKIIVTATPENFGAHEPKISKAAGEFIVASEANREMQPQPAGRPAAPFFLELVRSAQAFVVRRGSGKTVIAGYPWFLDWGRDTFICARGLLAAGMTEEVRQILVTFARFEKGGTLPNTIHGEDASNRDTSDAPLWFGVACEELAALSGEGVYAARADDSGRRIRDVLESIAAHYANGTPNSIRMDADSALIWSPAHFTWMDTNYPACTPREGYPIEIQALWIRLLRQLAGSGEPAERKRWSELAARALASLEKFFWLEERGWYADLLMAGPGRAAGGAAASDALRGNCLFPVSLGLIAGERARRCVEAAQRYLVVPGALRSLAPLPVAVPLPVHGADGRLLNHPSEPYWGGYEGDEDTRRKPAYHNGTAWTWTFPVFCEALARAWDFAPEAVAAARAYLGSMDRVMAEGCLGQVPEILDGDAPHTQRGCDAQAWGVTEALRVWKLLESRG